MPHPGGALHEMGDYNPQPIVSENIWGRVPKYALYPGGVRSRTDGQYHQLGPAVLANLYGVDLKDCLVVYEHELDEPWNRGRREQAASLPALRPRYDGNYAVPAGVHPSAEPYADPEGGLYVASPIRGVPGAAKTTPGGM